MLIFILTVIVFIIEGLTISILYNAAFEQQRAQLTATTQSQSKLIEAIAEFDEKFSQNAISGGAIKATMNQVRNAHSKIQGFGKTREFLFGKTENNKILFLLPNRFKTPSNHINQDLSIELGGQLAEPMQLALAGKSGTIIANDYRGEQVLAAYEPVKILNYGVVTKIDLQEIREPFIRVGLISITIAMILISIGAFLFLRITSPIIKNLKHSEAYNRMLFESSPIGLALCRMDGSLVDINQSYADIIGCDIDETKQISYWDITPEELAEEEKQQLEKLNTTGRNGRTQKENSNNKGERI